MSRSAHPAGPRHADVLPEGGPAAAPDDLNRLDARVWPGGTALDEATGAVTFASASKSVAKCSAFAASCR